LSSAITGNKYLLEDAPELAERYRALYKTGGLKPGQSTGWEGLDELYTIAPSQWTVVTGMPGAGKSEWLDAMLINLAEADDSWEFAMYSPENYPTETHIAKLVEKRVRKPFSPGQTDRMTASEAEDGMQWVMDHFYWLAPDLRTPDQLVITGLDYKRRGRKLGIVLDPWNTLDHERGGRSETDYTSYILTKITALARARKAHIWLVAHPQKIARNKDGTRPVPTPWDISGSAHWWNKADNVVCVHRDQSAHTQDVEIHIQKVRFKHCGHTGFATLKWDKVVGRYFEFPHGVAGETYMDPERRDVEPAKAF
jgi:twinkle protein